MFSTKPCGSYSIRSITKAISGTTHRPAIFSHCISTAVLSRGGTGRRRLVGARGRLFVGGAVVSSDGRVRLFHVPSRWVILGSALALRLLADRGRLILIAIAAGKDAHHKYAEKSRSYALSRHCFPPFYSRIGS
jgi:hypothetical protein